jgi:hypothetical protein
LLDIANELEAAAATLERQQDPHAGGVC